MWRSPDWALTSKGSVCLRHGRKFQMRQNSFVDSGLLYGGRKEGWTAWVHSYEDGGTWMHGEEEWWGWGVGGGSVCIALLEIIPLPPTPLASDWPHYNDKKARLQPCSNHSVPPQGLGWVGGATRWQWIGAAFGGKHLYQWMQQANWHTQHDPTGTLHLGARKFYSVKRYKNKLFKFLFIPV